MDKPLSDRQSAQILKLIADHHLAFTAEALGPDAIAPEQYARLVREGFIKPRGEVQHAQVAIPAAHAVGKMTVSNAKLARMKPEQFWKFIETAPPQFSAQELDAINAARSVVGRLITNLGVGLMNEMEHASHEEAAKLRHEALAMVQYEHALGLARRSSKEQIARRLKAKLAESERNWALVVQTELHNAQEHGKALSAARGGRNPLVYKLPKPDACRFCKLLFLNGSRPRVFRLNDLVKNGTNYTRRAGRPSFTGAGKTEWKATVGCVHPACQCEMFELPAGMVFNDKGDLVPSLRKALPDQITADLRTLLSHRCDA